MKTALAACLALFLCAPANAQGCLSRPSIQQQLMIAVTIDDARLRIAEVARLIEALGIAPAGVNECWKKVK